MLMQDYFFLFRFFCRNLLFTPLVYFPFWVEKDQATLSYTSLNQIYTKDLLQSANICGKIITKLLSREFFILYYFSISSKTRVKTINPLFIDWHYYLTLRSWKWNHIFTYAISILIVVFDYKSYIFLWNDEFKSRSFFSPFLD